MSDYDIPPAPAFRGELDSSVSLGDFLSALWRHIILFAFGLVLAVAAVYAYAQLKMTRLYKATARVEVGRSFDSEWMIGMSDTAAGSGLPKLNATYATENYDAMRRGLLAESILRSRGMQTAAAGAMGADAETPAKLDVTQLNNSGLLDVSVEMTTPGAAAKYLNTAFDLLRDQLIAHDFDYLKQARELYAAQATSETQALAALQMDYNRSRDAATSHGLTLSNDFASQAITAQIDAHEKWLAQLGIKISQLTLATRPEAQRAAVWLRVIDPANASATPSLPRPALMALIAAGIYTFVFFMLLAAATLASAADAASGRSRRSRL